MEWSEVGCTTQTGFGDVRVGRVVPDGDASGLDAVGGDGVLRAGAFETVAVFRVVNAGHATVMAGRGAQLREMFPHAVGLRAVTKRMYHVTQLTVDISKVFDGGLLPGKMPGFFGRAIYLTEYAVKANAYHPQSLKGDTDVVRMMLECSVWYSPEVCAQYEIGHFDRERTLQYDKICAAGLIRHAREYAYYDPRDVIIDRVIFYRCKDAVADGLPMAYMMPPVPAGGVTVVYITASLSEFFGKLNARIGGDPVKELELKRAIGDFLRRRSTTLVFVEMVKVLLGASSIPADLCTKLDAELAKGAHAAAALAAPAAPAAVVPCRPRRTAAALLEGGFFSWFVG